MKKIIFYKYCVLLIAIIFFVSCEDEETITPEVINLEVQVENEISLDTYISNLLRQEAIQSLLDSGNQNPTEDQITLESSELFAQVLDGELVIALSGDEQMFGYVVSNDENGNFFEELIVQDRAESPTIGVRIMINSNPLFSSFEFGRKIFVKVDGLFLGTRNNVLAIGGNDNIDKISQNLLSTVFTRSNEVATIIAKTVVVSEFDESLENIFIRLEDMQFPRESVFGVRPLTYASEPDDNFNGERTLESCNEDTFVEVSTSLFANFKSLSLPNGQGVVEGVLSRNFNDQFYILKLNDPSNIIFENGLDGRCKPFIEENFEDISSFTAIGWRTFNENSGSTNWIVGTRDNNKFAEISGFQSNESNIKAWVVSPSINMDIFTGEELNFEVQTSFDNGAVLKVFITTNFTGNVATTNWTDLNAAIPSGPPNSFGVFETVGPINIDSFEGNINIAFLYEGNDPGATTRFHIDNFTIN